MPRTYLISRGIAAYVAGFCLVWFGGIVGFVIIGQLPPERTLRNMGAILAALLVALVPALATALVPYRVTVSDDGMCSFRSLLRERRLRVDRIKEIDWDEDHMILRHDSGKARVLADPAFKPFLVHLLELNPMITVPDDLLSSLEQEGRA